jgi:type II secretory pathway pseudopilin PulG
MNHAAHHAKAFSLVEVIIAVGIFATAVVVTLGMLPALTRQSIESADTLVAQRLAGSIRVEARRIATSGGFDALATAIPVMAAPLVNGLELVADREGARLHAANYQQPESSRQIPDSECYFLIELWRYSQGALLYDSNGAVLPMYVRVSWPYRVPGSATPTPPAERQQLTFAVSITR